MSTPKYPKTVDILEPTDFIKGTLGAVVSKKGDAAACYEYERDGNIFSADFDGGHKEFHCLMGWCNKMFEVRIDTLDIVDLKTEYPEETEEYLAQQLLRAQYEVAQEEDLPDYISPDYDSEGDLCPTEAYVDDSIAAFNDNENVPFEVLSKVYNRFTAKLGYTEGNPEAKKTNRRGKNVRKNKK